MHSNPKWTPNNPSFPVSFRSADIVSRVYCRQWSRSPPSQSVVGHLA
ncbi:hypothetical protein SJ05684_a41340 (plasmid) [Sinorhizobium sojae CCBAU 05684]|uniref:Uncharacterized protein n=1 Tax=Sinorhizobium sojae CCBAU 05684 TaxID=716928 RepID=A0A249PNW1_9HYPH|nr:hypothetical protein SS05631_a49670 [Sinorhizobium sp. CCBAU 05631]ASY67447.1 hypothetical protein SJ05684_a41340 [Sinorhizobium sojae CCBAU 05684]ASY74313.1 hypothetical protein SF83666_a47270 [Sinorhizobium fredii CCBAU 83666]AWM30093.1 hypothetical protein AOX55_00004659 [Sinorhizobium fredii CCBAU 25509]